MPGNANPGGMTPTISCAVPLIETCSSDRCGITPVTLLPERVRQDRGPGTARDVFAGNNRPAEQRRDAKHRKELARDAQAQHLFGVTGSGQVHRKLMEGGDAQERSIARAPVEIVLSLDDVVALNAGRLLPDHDQAVRRWKGQRPQQHAVDDREERGGEADPERQRGCRDHDIDRISREASSGQAQVLNDAIDHAPSSVRTSTVAVKEGLEEPSRLSA